MQRLMKICARGALGVGVAAFLLSGIPVHAGPASSVPSQKSQPRLLAQGKAQPEETGKPEKQRLKEGEKEAAQQKQLEESEEHFRKGIIMRGKTPEATPPKSGQSRFGAGVIRKSEKPEDSE